MILGVDFKIQNSLCWVYIAFFDSNFLEGEGCFLVASCKFIPTSSGKLMLSGESCFGLLEQKQALVLPLEHSVSLLDYHPFQTFPETNQPTNLIYKSWLRDIDLVYSSFKCAWCSLDCSGFDNLISHFKQMHSEIIFEAIQNGSNSIVSIIAVEMNDQQELRSTQAEFSDFSAKATERSISENFNRNDRNSKAASKRKSKRKLLKKRNSSSVRTKQPSRVALSSLENESISAKRTIVEVVIPKKKRPSVSPNLANPVFYHSSGLSVIQKSDLHIDSEDDVDMSWHVESENLEIDEIRDIGSFEKMFMKLWNEAVREVKPLAYRDIPELCKIFISRFLILHEVMDNILALHLMTLFDNRLLSQDQVIECLQLYRHRKE